MDRLLTNIPETRDTSNIVGKILKTKADMTKFMPRLPLSIALDNAPVCLFK